MVSSGRIEGISEDEEGEEGGVTKNTFWAGGVCKDGGDGRDDVGEELIINKEEEEGG